MTSVRECDVPHSEGVELPQDGDGVTQLVGSFHTDHASNLAMSDSVMNVVGGQRELECLLMIESEGRLG